MINAQVYTRSLKRASFSVDIFTGLGCKRHHMQCHYKNVGGTISLGVER